MSSLPPRAPHSEQSENLGILAPAPLIDPDLEILLNEPLASALADHLSQASPGLKGKIQARVEQSKAASANKKTVRGSRVQAMKLGEGLQVTLLYQATLSQHHKLRPGEPLRASFIDIAAGQSLTLDDPSFQPYLGGLNSQREWLVLKGSVEFGGKTMRARDFVCVPAGQAYGRCTSPHGARLFLRETTSSAATPASQELHWVFDQEAGWPEYAPGIRRRVLWTDQSQAAMLYLTDAGAHVPVHSHGHDEECMMVQGELYLDDILLLEGDYQNAPAGTGHKVTRTETGVVLYAHGDLNLQFLPD